MQGRIHLNIAFFVILALLAFIAISGCTQQSSYGSGSTAMQPASVYGGSAKDPTDLIDKAWSMNAQGKFKEALSLIDQAAALDPLAPGIAFNRGWALTGLGRYSDPLTSLDQALAENPDSVISLSNKGFALAHLGRCDEARAAYNRALVLEPSNRAVSSSLSTLSSHCTAARTTSPTTVPVTTKFATQTSTKASTQSSGTVVTQTTSAPQQVAENINSEAVKNGGTEPGFIFSTPILIVSLYDYHWNNGKGDTPGTITIRNEKTGDTYGPYAAQGLPTQDGKQNVFWSIKPGITIPAGTYRIQDSNPSTWSQNAKTGGAGMTHIVYQVLGSTSFSAPGPATNLPLSQSYNDNRLSLKYPAGWTYKANTMGVAGFDDVSFFSTDNTTLLLFYAGNTGTSQTLDNFQANNLVRMMARYADFNLVSTKKTTLAGNPAIGTTFTWTSPKGDPQQTYVVVSIIDGREWQVYCTASPGYFEANLPVVNSIINTLQAGW